MKQKFVICTIVKNEQKFLKEWIDWNLKLGFNHIHIFEDINSDTHKQITDNYDNVFLHSIEEITYNEEEKHKSRQYLLFNWFIKNYKDNYEWCAFIDPDEFIQFDNGYDLDVLTTEFQEYVGVELWWKWYGSNGYIKSPNLLVQQAYHDDYCPHLKNCTRFEYKTLLNMSKGTKMMNVHRHCGVVNTDHVHDNIVFPVRTYNKAWIDHYRIKSKEDYETSLKRGNITQGLRTMNLYEKSLQK